MTRRRSFGDTVRRDEITSAAISLIAASGASRATLARIAEAAGLSNAAVLYYFRSKGDVIDAAYSRVIDAVGMRVGEAMSAAPSGRSAVAAYVHSLISYMSENPEQLRLVIEVAIADPKRAVEVPGKPPRWAPLAAAIERGQRENELIEVDARTTAIALGGAIDAIFTEAMNDPTYDLRTATGILLELFHRSTDVETAR
ncbi:TetR/AcrR family transcriptional regulator [Microbacterium caowuchunii]|uniref:TetR/AcrR family transcriptional regulator n=1 Tax=Microbacterium caowuchunii TaxID=2614638 RepID=UPI001247E0D9|nr:TetR/AcrR family transcriptional regulator [Microbacterium caowuchunii]QEW00168.1 TetR/AcrR family transcriptional regulator [Microbacterium caowuchunii]